MDNELRHPLTDLTAGSMLRVCDGEGRAIVVFEGQVWITQDNDQRDFVLSAGESFSVDQPGLTLVEAVRDSKLLVVDTRPGETTAPDSYALHQWAREQRSAAVAEALRRGALAVRDAVTGLAARALAPRPLPQAFCSGPRLRLQV
jgi:hypothetical protein